MMLTNDLKEQLVQKLCHAPLFGIQLDEITDVGGEAQLIIYWCFPNLKAKIIVELYLCCLQQGQKQQQRTLSRN